MAGSLPKEAKDFHKIPGAKLAILGSMWHAASVDGMMDRAVLELIACGVSPEDIEMHRVPGSFELPFAAKTLFEKKPELDGILAFGVVLQGITGHNESVLQNVVYGFSNVTEKFGKPIINEVIGVRSVEDAVLRSSNDNNNKGLEAVFAITELLHWKSSIS
jgi:6,7-dimethyl-8-ribityllumazine synthase